jgi:hypothetical protein
MVGQRTPGREADKLLIEHINKCYAAPSRQYMAARHHDHVPIHKKGVSLQSFGASQVNEHANIGMPLGHSRSYLVTEPLLQRDIDAGIGRKPAGQDIREVFFQRGRI